MTAIRVVAAVLTREGRALLGCRPPEKRHGNLWEFPGGKVDPGETAADAARRELDEELGLIVTWTGPALFSVTDPASPFVIDFHAVEATGEPRPFEHSAVGWFEPEAMQTMELAPADASFAAWLLDQGSVRR